MPDRKKLEEALATLHAELRQLDHVDPEVERELQTALADIEVALGNRSEEEASDEESPPVQDRLTDAMRHFEESHPTLSGVIGSVIDTLSRMGI
ncbi:MAG: DUF4404 family protein [Pirellulales bacterium]